MRKFYLEDQNGSRIDLNSQETILFAAPEGLGADYDNEYSDSFDGFFITAKHQPEMAKIEGKLLFLSDPYEMYRAFMAFVSSASELYFVYDPYEAEEYRRLVRLSQISKSELNKYGILECSVAFDCLTPWHTKVPVSFGWASDDVSFFVFNVTKLNTGALLSDKIYEFWRTGIEAAEQMDASMRLKIIGRVVNPVVRLVGAVTGTVYGQITVRADIELGQSLTIDSNFINSHVTKQYADGTEEDYIPSLDLTENFFFKVPTTENCYLTITYDKYTGMNVVGEIYYYYRSV